MRDAASEGEQEETREHLRGHEDVGHVLVLAQERQVQDDLDRLGVSGHDDQLRNAAVQRLRSWDEKLTGDRTGETK
jgi:hypothetical protein